jgi:uncharacterized protein YwqG
MARDRENLRKLIREAGVGALEEELMKHARPSIRVETTPVEDEATIPIGQSKIGGRPDLPRDTEWPKVNVVGDKIRSLPFIAQFNLQEVAPHDEEGLLPEHGILYFFGGMFLVEKYRWGRVFFFDGDPALLERRPFPDDIPPTEPQKWGERFDPCAVKFVLEVNLSHEDETLRKLEVYHDDDDFYDLIWDSNYPELSKNGAVNRLLGYAFNVEDLKIDCELIAAGISPLEPYVPLYQKYRQTKERWRLLFQMDSDVNAGMMWSDSGVACFYITQDDLKNHNFDDVCLTFFTS